MAVERFLFIGGAPAPRVRWRSPGPDDSRSRFALEALWAPACYSEGQMPPATGSISPVM